MELKDRILKVQEAQAATQRENAKNHLPKLTPYAAATEYAKTLVSVAVPYFSKLEDEDLMNFMLIDEGHSGMKFRSRDFKNKDEAQKRLEKYGGKLVQGWASSDSDDIIWYIECTISGVKGFSGYYDTFFYGGSDLCRKINSILEEQGLHAVFTTIYDGIRETTNTVRDLDSVTVSAGVMSK